MFIITAVFLLISGIFAAIAKVTKNTKASEFIAVYILGISTLILAKDLISDATGTNQTLIFLLIGILSVSFALGELLKKKSQIAFVAIPILLSLVFLFFPELSNHSYMGHATDDLYMLLVIAILSASTPPLMQIANGGIKILTAKFSPILWNKTDAHLLESALAYAFIGGLAALGGFLLGKVGLLVAATFFLSSSFIARNRTSVTPSLLLSTSSAMFIISAAFIILNQAGYDGLDLTNGEVLQGTFMAGFIAILYELFIRLAQHRKGKWRALLTFKAVFVPLLFIFLLGFAYTQLERLGGVLTLTSLLISLAALSLLYSTFKIASNIIGLNMISLGFILLIAPMFSPIKQSSGIDLSDLGIEQSTDNKKTTSGESYHDRLDEPNGNDLSQANGDWEINEEVSKIFFELGPKSGRVNGELTKIKGKFTIAEEIENSSIDVVIPSKHISTFNSMRDESLLEDEFLHVEKHPEMTFTANNFTAKNDAYEVNGEFTLLGITKPHQVILKLVGVGEKDGEKVMVLWGKSSLNRTDFGMPSSAKIGDVVDFHFEVQLTK